MSPLCDGTPDGKGQHLRTGAVPGWCIWCGFTMELEATPPEPAEHPTEACPFDSWHPIDDIA